LNVDGVRRDVRAQWFGTRFAPFCTDNQNARTADENSTPHRPSGGTLAVTSTACCACVSRRKTWEIRVTLVEKVPIQ
jgi:hypothetical protein